MIWLNDTREQIKKENPGISVTEVAKKGGEMWKEMKDKSKWEEKATKAKADYTEAMNEYKAKGGGTKSEAGGSGEKRKKEQKTPTKVTGGSFKSKEYISDDDSSSDSDKDKKKAKKPKVSIEHCKFSEQAKILS